MYQANPNMGGGGGNMNNNFMSSAKSKSSNKEYLNKPTFVNLGGDSASG